MVDTVRIFIFLACDIFDIYRPCLCFIVIDNNNIILPLDLLQHNHPPKSTVTCRKMKVVTEDLNLSCCVIDIAYTTTSHNPDHYEVNRVLCL